MSYGNKDIELLRHDPKQDYNIKEKIGSGTYGEVYRARCYRTNIDVAIKKINIEHGDDMNAIKQEIQMMASLKHMNIISYFGSYLRDDKLWIAMEYCGGGSMQDIYSG